MSYATPADVKACFRNFASSTEAAVTDIKIQAWLDATSAMIDGRIGTLYALPINETDSPLSFEILKQIESFKVAGIVDDVLNTYSEADKKPLWEKRAMDMLKELVPPKDSKGNQPSPTTKLPDATYIGTQTQKSTIRASSTNAPIFTKGGDNW